MGLGVEHRSASASGMGRLRIDPLSVVAAALVCLAAPALFVIENFWLGFALLALGLVAAWVSGVRGNRARDGADGSAANQAHGAAHSHAPQSLTQAPGRPPSLVRDLSLIVIGLLIVRTIPLAAELDNFAMVRFTLALGGAVAVPYLVSRFIYRDRAIGFPWRGGGRWGKLHWFWLAGVVVAGVAILPVYFITSGVYENWPVVDDADLIARLFVGVGAVGIWDELFFICTAFAVLLRHFPIWLANVLQSIVFVSFLWELGYRAWGPALTIPFALMQGYIFLRTRSLAYVVTVHLLFDAVVFAVLVYAHNR